MQKSAICEPTLKNSTNSAIIIAVEKLMKMDTDNFFRGPINWNVEVSIDLVNPIDLYSIKIKANSNLYESADEFLYDIRMIHHNAIIILGKNDQLTKTIEEICHQAFDDYCGITYCVGCYIKASMDPNFYKSDDFLQPCIPAHGLVWAQKSGDLPDYPAKIIKYYPEKYCPEKKMVLKNIIDVCFFGSREIFTELKIDMCFLLSKQRPNSSIISKEFAFQLSSDVKKHTSLLENLKANQPDAVTQIFYSDETELDITKMYLPNNLKKQDMSKIVPSSEIGEITDNTSNKRIRTLTNESKIKELEEEVSALKSKLEIANRKIKELKKGRKSEAKRESIYALCDNTKKIDEQENIASSEPKNAAKKADEQVNIAKSNLQNNLTDANNKIESLENILNNKKKVKQDLCCRIVPVRNAIFCPTRTVSVSIRIVSPSFTPVIYERLISTLTDFGASFPSAMKYDRNANVEIWSNNVAVIPPCRLSKMLQQSFVTHNSAMIRPFDTSPICTYIKLTKKCIKC
ncbi:hypothetical protein BLOT_000219 [Blomia tropicalis]|nr:hypothetical protein BLOT_000219 [Blomia tropicalis]